MLVIKKCKPPRRDDDKVHGDFYPEVHLVATKLVLVVSTNTSIVLGQGSQAAGHSGHAKTPLASAVTQ